MKKIAFIFILIFTLVQAGPAIACLYNPEQAVFIVDEEKSEDKSKAEKKDGKKELSRPFSFYFQIQNIFSGIRTSDDLILPCPSLELLSPPPNFY